MRRRCAHLILGALFVAGGCHAFGDDPPPSPAAVDGGGGDAAPDVAADGSVGNGNEDEGGTSGGCTSLAPTCALRDCAQETIGNDSDTFPFAIATDAANIYWVEQSYFDGGGGNPYDGAGVGRIMRYRKAGAKGVEILAAGQAGAKTIAVVGNYIYWATETPLALARVDRACTPPCIPRTFPLGGKRIDEMRVVGSTIYLLDGEGVVKACNGATASCKDGRAVGRFSTR